MQELLIIVGVYVIAFVLFGLFKRKKARPAPAVVKEATRAEVISQALTGEMDQKAEQAHELARMELAHIEAQRAQLLRLYEGIEAERDAATTQARKNSLTRQLINLDEKIFKLDIRKARVYSAAYAA